jgi:hypothetical protein
MQSPIESAPVLFELNHDSVNEPIPLVLLENIQLWNTIIYSMTIDASGMREDHD